MSATDFRRACIGCAGDGWLSVTGDDGRPLLRPCPECRPVTAQLNRRGAYAADAPVEHADRDRLAAEHAGHQPRTALYPIAPIVGPPGR